MGSMLTIALMMKECREIREKSGKLERVEEELMKPLLKMYYETDVKLKYA